MTWEEDPTRWRRSPFADRGAGASAGRFGLWLFLASLGMLFAASIAGFLVIRIQLARAGTWPDDLPPMPEILWLSTGLLLLSSGTIQLAVLGARAGHGAVVKLAMSVTLLLALAFVGLQGQSWWTWLQALGDRWSDGDPFRFAFTGFYLLTGLHAVHVVGGIVPMFVVTVGAWCGAYRPDAHDGLRLCALYWHFLDVVWLGVFLTLMVGM